MNFAVPSINIKEYVSGTIGTSVQGTWYYDDALEYLRSTAPKGTVIIPELLKLDWQLRRVEPHPDCKAQHSDRGTYWTTITCRAFPDVDDAHRHAVQSFGGSLTSVRVPVIEDIRVEDVLWQ